jgi:hypothetical protein
MENGCRFLLGKLRFAPGLFKPAATKFIQMGETIDGLCGVVLVALLSCSRSEWLD